MRRVTVAFCISVALAFSTPTVSKADTDPSFLPGTDPGGIAITLVGPGIDYTIPELSNRLARDGEGTPIGWDFLDNDHMPFLSSQDDASRADTTTVKALLKAYSKSRLIVVRTNLSDAPMTARAIAMASKMPAGIIAVPELPRVNGPKIISFLAEKTPGKLFVVPATEGWTDAVPDNVVRVAAFSNWVAMQGASVEAWMTKPGAGLFGNLIIQRNTDHARTQPLAVVRAAANAGCAQHTATAADGRAARDAFLKLAKPSKSRPGVLVHDPLCFYGGQLLKR